jgi:hypothetical protein
MRGSYVRRRDGAGGPKLLESFDEVAEYSL